jgi:hypothetical protein
LSLWLENLHGLELIIHRPVSEPAEDTVLERFPGLRMEQADFVFAH